MDNTPKIRPMFEVLQPWTIRVAAYLGITLLGLLCLTTATKVVNEAVTRRMSDDLRWRESLATISNVPQPIDGALVVTSIRPFLKSARHKEEALIAGRLALGRVSQHDAFKELYESVYESSSLQDLDHIVEIDRRLNDRRSENESSQAWFGRAYQTPPVKGRNKTTSASDINVIHPEVARLRREDNETLKNISFVCDRIGEILRKPRGDHSNKLDLNNLYFYNCDLSGADLSRAVLTGVLFQDTDLSGTIFKDVGQFDYASFSDVEWWKAKEISAPLLAMLKDRFYPYFNGDIYNGKKLNKEDYFSNLQRLCKAVSLDCTSAPAKFP